MLVKKSERKKPTKLRSPLNLPSLKMLIDHLLITPTYNATIPLLIPLVIDFNLTQYYQSNELLSTENKHKPPIYSKTSV